MHYHYKVIDENMSITKGVLDAVDLEAAKRIIFENSWQIIELQEDKSLWRRLNKNIEGKLSYESISAFCSQMAMMIKTGANMVKGMEILKTQTRDKRLKNVLTTMIGEVSRGSSLSASMKTSGVLPDLLINLVAVGEQSGSLDTVLNNMADYYERENFIRKKITSASIYPLILTAVLIIIVVFFINFILPEITGLLAQSGGELPLITRIVITSATFLTDNFLYIFAFLVIMVVLYLKLCERTNFRYYRDALKLKLPLLGINIQNVITARFCRTMSLFLKASIPIVDILNSMETIVGNEVPKNVVENAKEKIIRGKGFAESFGEEEFFDQMVIQMMIIGEETGQLDDLMGEMADYYDKQVELGINKMVSLVEPIFTIVIGIFAAIMIIAVALPIFTMSESIQ